ncbi:MAG: hypothetical protein HF978_00445 [Desulfobacteraceae bacterium]|nr:hypothetical protein [Desulfobacteraceae bacterium]MBC2754003.1 hypothetical protein [Desulfobacteraceae bacterium]
MVKYFMNFKKNNDDKIPLPKDFGNMYYLLPVGNAYLSEFHSSNILTKAFEKENFILSILVSISVGAQCVQSRLHNILKR